MAKRKAKKSKRKGGFKIGKNNWLTVVGQVVSSFILVVILEWLIYGKLLAASFLTRYAKYTYKVSFDQNLSLLLSLGAVILLVLFYNFARGLTKKGAGGAVQLALILAVVFILPNTLGQLLYLKWGVKLANLVWSMFAAESLKLVAIFLLLDLLGKKK